MASLLKDIEGYEGLYKVSSSGDVFSMPRPGSRSKEPYKMFGGTDQFGYRLVGLTKNGRNKTFRVHRLVANAFLPNPHGYSEINHKDENKENNAAANLEWNTQIENHNHGTINQRISRKLTNNPKKSKPIRALTDDGKEVFRFPSVYEASRVTGINPSSIRDSAHERNIHGGGYIWRFI